MSRTYMKENIDKFITQLKDSFNSIFPPFPDPNKPKEISINRQRTLVKPRPLSVQERYLLLEDQEQLDEIFIKIRDHIYGAIDEVQQSNVNQFQAPVIYREKGKFPSNRPYFYLKPFNKTGWLFERSGTGWLISRAEKIIGRDLFLRAQDPWDTVAVYSFLNNQSQEISSGRETGKGYPRVSSRQMGQELISLLVYKQKIINTLNLFAQD